MFVYSFVDFLKNKIILKSGYSIYSMGVDNNHKTMCDFMSILLGADRTITWSVKWYSNPETNYEIFGIFICDEFIPANELRCFDFGCFSVSEICVEFVFICWVFVGIKKFDDSTDVIVYLAICFQRHACIIADSLNNEIEPGFAQIDCRDIFS